MGVHAWRGMSVYIHNIYNYDWSIILQGSPDICVTSVDEPHAIGEVYISIVLCYNLHVYAKLVGECSGSKPASHKPASCSTESSSTTCVAAAE